MKFTNSKKGFTIAELTIVMAVVVLIFAVSFMVLNGEKRVGQANDARRLEDVIAIARAVEIYSIENQQLPSDFSTSTLSVGEKFVLCASEATLTCDGQTTGCLVVDDSDFLQMLPDLPVDPVKTSSADTGYYVTRTSNDALAIGACDSYDTDGIEKVAKATLPDLVASCGDGFVDTGETCDDGDNFTEGCGNNVEEDAGSYCNSNCSAVITLTEDEACDDGDAHTEVCGDAQMDYGTFCDATCENELTLTETCEYYTWTNDCDMFKVGWVTEPDLGGSGWCQSNCRLNTGFCMDPP